MGIFKLVEPGMLTGRGLETTNILLLNWKRSRAALNLKRLQVIVGESEGNQDCVTKITNDVFFFFLWLSYDVYGFVTFIHMVDAF